MRSADTQQLGMFSNMPDVKAWTLWAFATCSLVRIGGPKERWEPAPT
jgi:hypothetical protein